jgi:hypothetical protein
MVVTFVLKVNVPSEFTIEQYKEKLEKRLETLKPDKISSFQVQTIVYQPTSQQTVVSVHQILHSEYPANCFSVLDQLQQNDSTKVLTGDIGLASIQRRLCELGVFSEKKQLNMECIGTSYKLGDFQLKIGAVIYAGTNRGLICEISYTLGNTNSDTWGIINEFLQSVLEWNLNEKSQFGGNLDQLTQYVRKKPHIAPYCPEDIILQYFELFNNYRSANIGK